MKFEQAVKIHNRFDIVKNGKWVGQGENVVLTRMYDRLVAGSSFFTNINFGTGTGTPSPGDTGLFVHLGSKTASNDSLIKAIPVSRITKKIVLMPEEYVGQTITEVGVAYGSANNNVVTHAIIKDSEGNPLTITKSDIDVIEIYATVFSTFIDGTAVIYKNPLENELINYLTTSSSSFPSTLHAQVTHYMYDVKYPLLDGYDMSKATTANSMVYTYRIPITDDNYHSRIEGLSLNYYSQLAAQANCICTANLDTLGTLPMSLTNQTIGVADGETTKFNIQHTDVSNVVVKLDGQVVPDTDYTVTSDIDSCGEYLPICYLLDDTDPNYTPDSLFTGLPAHPKVHSRRGSPAGDVTDTTMARIHGAKLLGKKIAGYINGGYSSRTIRIRASVDGSTWDTLINGTSDGLYISDTINTEYNFLEVYMRGTTSSSFAGYYNANASVVATYDSAFIEFATPPASGTITVDYTVPYYPKDENYVMDITFEITFGEGV